MTTNSTCDFCEKETEKLTTLQNDLGIESKFCLDCLERQMGFQQASMMFFLYFSTGFFTLLLFSYLVTEGFSIPAYFLACFVVIGVYKLVGLFGDYEKAQNKEELEKVKRKFN